MGIWCDRADEDSASFSLYIVTSHEDANFSQLELVIFCHDGVVVVVVEEHDVWSMLEAVTAVVYALVLALCDYVSVVGWDGWHGMGYYLINSLWCRLLKLKDVSMGWNKNKNMKIHFFFHTIYPFSVTFPIMSHAKWWLRSKTARINQGALLVESPCGRDVLHSSMAIGHQTEDMKVLFGSETRVYLQCGRILLKGWLISSSRVFGLGRIQDSLGVLNFFGWWECMWWGGWEERDFLGYLWWGG